MSQFDSVYDFGEFKFFKFTLDFDECVAYFHCRGCFQILAHLNWTVANIQVNDSVNVESLSVPVDGLDNGVSVNLALVLGGISYITAPAQYLGNKLTAYGNNLTYTLTYSGSAEGELISANFML